MVYLTSLDKKKKKKSLIEMPVGGKVAVASKLRLGHRGKKKKDIEIATHQTVVSTLAFLYQVNRGFSPLLVSVSSMYAQRSMNSSWLRTLVSFPVMARYTSSMTLKSVGKKMSK